MYRTVGLQGIASLSGVGLFAGAFVAAFFTLVAPPFPNAVPVPTHLAHQSRFGCLINFFHNNLGQLTLFELSCFFTTFAWTR